ncbi:homoserine dehydrogenase [Clostridioides mangenotii]|uniref:homoserine dehydrogenase n=1 Tax=Metaclostridioides mangenotii TaxID=1540 RepID=UPI001C114BE6|nr:homoserine dehydrogenase [Clostridioides mangenotii]MBU5308692.1 homoserine dehydrogenase [Clostridioides mangenotii]MCR1955044.1 homoserine dehydrogenase [Clostridioides mangenotii]
MNKKIRIGLLGYGVVGSGFIDVVEKNKCKNDIEISKILVNNIEKHRNKEYYDVVTESIDEVFDSNIDILVEVMGNIAPTFEYIKRALNNNIHVVTANKDLMAEKGYELTSLAIKNNVSLKFEASVAGGIPIIKSIIESLGGNRINSINAILNGTTNFILSKMYEENLSYEVALKQAQELGFAESNPDSDVLGYDAARKLAILSTLAYDKQIYWKDTYLEGITSIDEKDIEYAKQIGCKIKLIGYSKYENDKVSAFVRPVLVEKDNILARIDNEFNIVVVNGDSVGEVSFVGKGAGSLATGSAVYSDVVDIIDNRISNIESFGKEKIIIKQTIKERCGALLRFINYNKTEIINIINSCFINYEILNNDDKELVILVNANSEYEINNSLCLIQDKGYCEKYNKLLKIV